MFEHATLQLVLAKCHRLDTCASRAQSFLTFGRERSTNDQPRPPRLALDDLITMAIPRMHLQRLTSSINALTRRFIYANIQAEIR